MKKHLLLVLLFQTNLASAIPNNIGFQFQETFFGYFCIEEKYPENCDPKFATDRLSIFFHITKDSANHFFKDLDLQMEVVAKVYFNNEEFIALPGLFKVDDRADDLKKINYHYNFEYIESDHDYIIDIEKVFYEDYADEDMWNDLTTMFVTRREKFGNGIYMPAGAGIIMLPKDAFTIFEWISNFKTIGGNLFEEMEFQTMALDYFIFDRFDKVYNGVAKTSTSEIAEPVLNVVKDPLRPSSQ